MILRPGDGRKRLATREHQRQLEHQRRIQVQHRRRYRRPLERRHRHPHPLQQLRQLRSPTAGRCREEHHTHDEPQRTTDGQLSQRLARGLHRRTAELPALAQRTAAVATPSITASIPTPCSTSATASTCLAAKLTPKATTTRNGATATTKTTKVAGNLSCLIDV